MALSAPSGHRPGRQFAVPAALLLVLAAPTAAWSAVRPAGVFVDPGYGPPLAFVKVAGTGFCPAPCGPVLLRLAGVYVQSDVPVARDGTFAVVVQVPGSARPGPAAVVADQADTTARGTFTVTISVAAPTRYPRPTSVPPPGGLPPPRQPTAPVVVDPLPPATPVARPAGPSPAPPATPTPRLAPTPAGTPVELVAASRQAARRPATGPSSRWLLLGLAAAGLGGVGVLWWRRRGRAG